MVAIDIIVPSARMRRWHRALIDRLEMDGHDISIRHGRRATDGGSTIAASVTRLERFMLRGRGNGLCEEIATSDPIRSERPADLVIDLPGNSAASGCPTLGIVFEGTPSSDAVLSMLAAGRLPQVAVVCGGQAIGEAHPMVDRREFVALAADDVFARAVTLAAQVVDSFARTGEKALQPQEPQSEAASACPDFLISYAGRTLPRLAREVLRRSRYRPAHWRTGFRFIDGDGVAETGSQGTGWSVIPEDGTRFFADPFVIQVDEAHHIFIEDYPHATGKAVISHVSIGADGKPSAPEPVLEEPHHLSYPNVFSRDGEIWMLPEASASGKLTLYRAERFPDRWVREAVLVENREISDATLLDHEGRLWMFATQRDGYGSTSDTMVVFHADTLTGPWTPHRQNPIVIDRRRARPGGSFVRTKSGILLPVQDGTLGYGGGLGLARLEQLDTQTVRFAEPAAIAAGGDWPYPQIHTLNRAGRLEVIDGIAAVKKR